MILHASSPAEPLGGVQGTERSARPGPHSPALRARESGPAVRIPSGSPPYFALTVSSSPAAAILETAPALTGHPRPSEAGGKLGSGRGRVSEGVGRQVSAAGTQRCSRSPCTAFNLCPPCSATVLQDHLLVDCTSSTLCPSPSPGSSRGASPPFAGAGRGAAGCGRQDAAPPRWAPVQSSLSGPIHIHCAPFPG